MNTDIKPWMVFAIIAVAIIAGLWLVSLLTPRREIGFHATMIR